MNENPKPNTIGIPGQSIDMPIEIKPKGTRQYPYTEYSAEPPFEKIKQYLSSKPLRRPFYPEPSA